jgi:hypothetical protein
MTPDLWT